MDVRLHFLGVPFAELQGGRVEIRPARPALLLLYLAWHGDWLSRESLAWLFRPADDEERARTNLRLLLSRARKYPWAAGIEVERNRLRFRPATDLAGPVTRGSTPPQFLAGWSAEAELGDWLEVQRADFRERWRDQSMSAAQQLEETGRHAEALDILGQLLDDDPLAEDALQAYLRSSAHTTARQQGRQRYLEFSRQLRSELGLEPLEETRLLAEALNNVELPRPRSARSVRSGTFDVPLVGRAEALRRAAATGPGRALITVGEAGVGKSRLIQEALAEEEQLWLQGRSGLAAVPWLPVTAALRAAGAEQLHALVALPELSVYRAELSSLLPELARPSRSASHSEPHRVLEAAAALLRRLQPGLAAVVFDDAQWLDPETIRLLHFLHGQGDLRLFITVRSGSRGAAWESAERQLLDGREAQRLQLGPLSEAETGELLSLAAGRAAPADLLSTVSAATGGNPLMLLQSVADWRERGWLGADAVADWAQLPPEAFRPQEGLAGLLLARINSLDGESRRVLDAAAVLGSDLDARVLRGMAALSERATVRLLGSLEDQGLLRGRAFAHGYIREVVLDELPTSSTRHLHARAARALKDSGADELLVAGHLEAAGDLEGAAELWFSSANSRFAAQPGFEAEAGTLYQRVLDSGVRTDSYYRAAAYRSGQLLSANEREQAEALIRAVLDESTDPVARTFALLQQVVVHYLDGRLADAEETASQAYRLVQEVESDALHSDVQLMRSMLLSLRQQYGESLEISSSMVEQLRLKPPSFALGSWLARLAGDLSMLGRFEEALAVHHEQLAVARQTRHRRQQAAAVNDILATLDDLGRVGEGLELALEGLALGTFDVSWPLLLHLALARRARGDTEGARADLQKLLSGTPSVTTRAYGLALLAELSEDADEAEAAVAAGLALTSSTELLEARVITAVAAARFGSQQQRTAALDILRALDLDSLPAHLTPRVQDALTT